MDKSTKLGNAQEFEKRVRSVLKRAGFQDVNGGNKFYLGRNQIDASGGSENTLLIIECKTRSTRKPGFLDPIRKLRGQIDSIRAGTKENLIYKKYDNFRFIVATNSKFSRFDRIEARKGRTRKIHLWDRDFTNYYDQLSGKIGEVTKYSILGELGVTPKQSKEEGFPCVRSSFYKDDLFFFLAYPRQLLKWAYVARREVGKEHYYQRLIESRKLQEICRYVQEEGGYFPNAIVLAINGKANFTPLSIKKKSIPQWSFGKIEFGTLNLPAIYRSCWIIDGQHRLYGAAKAKTAIRPLPIVALEHPTLEDQARLFLEINENQKPVPPDLVWDLRGEMQQADEKGIISQVAKELNRKGVLQHRVYIPLGGPRRKGQLKLSSICMAIYKFRLTDRVLRDNIGNPLYRNDINKRIRSVSKSINSSLSVINRIFDSRQKQQFWFQNSGVGVLLALVGKINARCKHAPSEYEYRKYLKPLKGHFQRYRSKESIKGLRQRCTSEGGRDEIVAEFCKAISRELKDPEFDKGIPEDKFERRIKRVERAFGDLMKGELSRDCPNWLNEHVPEDVRNRALKLMRKEHATVDKVHDFISFGDIITIVRRADNFCIFEPHLITRGGFDSINQLESGARTINELRGRTMHGRGHFNEDDEALLNGYLGKFENILKLKGLE